MSSITFTHREFYSRLQLLFRVLLGELLIQVPHIFLLCFIGIVQHFYRLFAGIGALFTGKISRYYFDFQVGVLSWQARVLASSLNIIDGYPKFGLSARHPDIAVTIDYSEDISRIMILIILLFSPILLIPQLIVLVFFTIAASITNFCGALIVLFRGRYPRSIYAFHAGIVTLHFSVGTYSHLICYTYPPITPSATIVEENSKEVS